MSHDPLCEFAWAFSLIVVLNLSRIVSKVIKAYSFFCARQFKNTHPDLYADMLSRAPGSIGVGLLEQILYVYCLTSTHREFIGSILLFKGFLGWLQASAMPSGSTSAAATITGRLEFTAPSTNTTIPFTIPATPVLASGGSTRGEYRGMLAGFYIYAVGNFISLGFAILVFEVVHLWDSRLTPLIFSGIFCSK